MKRFLSYFIASLSYVGYLPKAPGTFGSLTAIPLFYLLPSLVFLTLIPLVFIIGWAVSYKIVKDDPLKTDPSFIVIDELCGMMIALSPGVGYMHEAPLRMSLPWGIVAFFLFRYFDIFKPWLIGAVDLFFKKKAPFLASLGIMVDDVLAAIIPWALGLLIF